jgi:hypothetical protein
VGVGVGWTISQPNRRNFWPLPSFRTQGAYVESAQTLDRVHGGAPRFYPPTYFLLGQAMELVLKAHLSASGVSKRRLRNCIGHDIALAFRYGVSPR